jgi:hypothetical protein
MAAGLLWKNRSGGKFGMITEKNFDKEWVRLIIQAKKMGLSPDEVRDYLRQSSLSSPTMPKTKM